MTGGAVTGGQDRFLWHPSARLADATTETGIRTGDNPPSAIADQPATMALAQAMARAAQGRAFRIGAVEQPAPDDATPPAFETLTSGTSGQPRRIRRTQSSWIASFTQNARAFGIGPDARVALLGRLSHSLSLYGAVEGLHLGAAVHVLDSLRPDRQRRALAERGITHLYATPAQLRLLADAGGPSLALSHILVGGSKLDAALRQSVAQMAPQSDTREFYGASETSFITLADDDTPPESVGKPYPGVSLQIRDTAGRPLPDGQTGLVWVRSPLLFDGYGDGLFGPARRDGDWLSVGEMGWLERGCLYLAGRAGRMVTIADQNVFPEQIEAFLATLSGITRVAVLPKPDALRGTVLVAVALGDPAQTDAILHAARSEFGALKAPRELVWRGDWPELTSGKPDLARLAQEAGL